MYMYRATFRSTLQQNLKNKENKNPGKTQREIEDRSSNHDYVCMTNEL